MRKMTGWILALLGMSATLNPGPTWQESKCPMPHSDSTAGLRPPGALLRPCDWNGKATFIDPRDQQEYRQVQIGGQCWMASNLQYGAEVQDMEQQDNQRPECTCYQNQSVNCTRYGGLYTWEEATGHSSPQGRPIQGLCPDGWHLPTDAEWAILEQALDPAIAGNPHDWRGAVLAHRLIGADAAWVPPAQQREASGFEALPGGIAVSGWFFYLGRGAYFWTASPYSAAAAWSRGILSQAATVYRGPSDKSAGLSVRCLKDP